MPSDEKNNRRSAKSNGHDEWDALQSLQWALHQYSTARLAADGTGRDDDTDWKVIQILWGGLEYLKATEPSTKSSIELRPFLTKTRIDKAHPILVSVTERTFEYLRKDVEAAIRMAKNRGWVFALEVLVEQRAKVPIRPQPPPTPRTGAHGEAEQRRMLEEHVRCWGRLLAATRHTMGDLPFIGSPSSRAQKMVDPIVDDVTSVYPDFGTKLRRLGRALISDALAECAETRRGKPRSGEERPQRHAIDKLLASLCIRASEEARTRARSRARMRTADAAKSRPETADAKDGVRQRIVEAARRHPNKSGRALLARVEGADKVKWAVLKELIQARVLVNTGTEPRPMYSLAALRETSGG